MQRNYMHYEPHMLKKIKDVTLELNDAAYNHLMQKIGNAQIVMIGEATHGTHEFYTIRAEITKKLIVEKGFHAIALEGDWPDAYHINAYVTKNTNNDMEQALSAFNKFPTWMWRNTVMLDFVRWLKRHNQTDNPVLVYGLDLYSLYASIDVIIRYLEKITPDHAHEARTYYACFEQFRHDPQTYGYSVLSGLARSCQDDVMQALKKLTHIELQLLQEHKTTSAEAFYILQNARVIEHAEEYYRSLFLHEVSNWNLRDDHMMETLEEIIAYYKQQGIEKPKIVVWAHNSHIGNAAATAMSMHGEFNIGQLVKEKFATNAYSIGFTTYNGTVSAASNWHQPVERKIVRNALPHSYEYLFHQLHMPSFLLTLDHKDLLPKTLLERAIGVVYVPHQERASHYFEASLAQQFDAIIHYDTTTALEPLEKTTLWIEGEAPETYPSGL